MATFSEAVKTLKFKPSDLSREVLVTSIAKKPFEVKILYYKKGTIAPTHRHSTNTHHILLSGKVRVSRPGKRRHQSVDAIGDYECGKFEYQLEALTDSYIMLIQKPGTKFIKSRT